MRGKGIRGRLRPARSVVVAVAALALLASACDDRGFVQGMPATDPFSVVPRLTPADQLRDAPATEQHVSYAPAVPAVIDRADQTRWSVALEVVEGVCPLDPANDVETLMWGYRVDGDDEVACGTPGPVLRGRVGDLVTIRLTNPAGNQHPHNIDFHAVTGQGGGARDLTVAPGESASIEVRLLYPGAFMYHCAFGDVPEHIARGMYGMFIVDPEEPLPAADHEWAVMQSEWYVTDPGGGGTVDLDRDALFAEEPRYVTFNGRTDALTGDNALRMQVGERARIHMVNEGLNLASNFHPIGSHWDAVWVEGATHEANEPIRGSQSTLVVAGGGTVVDIVAQVPSTILLVDHALVRTFYKGAVGQIVVSGPEDPEVYAGMPVAGSATPAEGEGGEAQPPADDNAVSIPEGAYLPDNADQAYLPGDLTVAVGTTVTWTNDDILPHTVTSGTSDGRTGTPDGTFDSGNMDPGATFEVTFDEAGTFAYYCIPHPWMRGTVTVTP